MRWATVARHEAALTVGTRSGKLLLGLLVSVVLLVAYVFPVVAPDPITTATFSTFASGSLTTLVPLLGVLLGYNAIVSQRESGSIKLTLSLPRSRRDLVLGTFLGRGGVLAGAIVLAMVGAGVLVVYPFGDLELLRYLAFVLLVIVFGAIWIGLGLAVSLSVSTKRRALVLGFGIFFVFVVAWDAAPGFLELGLNAADLVDGELPDPVRFVFALGPGNAFETLVAGFIDPTETVDEPWYLGEWVALAVVAFWAVCPLGLAFSRFNRSDLS